MNKYTVYGISNWPESLGEKFVIFENAEFESELAAAAAAQSQYDKDLEVIVVSVL